MPKDSHPSSLLRKPREDRFHGAVSYGICPKVSTSLAGVGRVGASGSAPSSRFKPLSVVLSAAKALDSILTRNTLAWNGPLLIGRPVPPIPLFCQSADPAWPDGGNAPSAAQSQ